jgi:hypothetical protein
MQCVPDKMHWICETDFRDSQASDFIHLLPSHNIPFDGRVSFAQRKFYTAVDQAGRRPVTVMQESNSVGVTQDADPSER